MLERVREVKNPAFTTAAFAFVVYGIVELLGYSGAIASLACGVALGNPEVFRVAALTGLRKLYRDAFSRFAAPTPASPTSVVASRRVSG